VIPTVGRRRLAIKAKEAKDMDPGTLIAALAALVGWLTYIRDASEKKRAEEQRAIQAIYTAAASTRSYINDVQPPIGRGADPRDQNREAELSNLWMNAGLALQRIDYELAQKCEVKSGYWSNPDGWSPAQVRLADIELDKVFALADELRRALE
jgi:hypothetical protein